MLALSETFSHKTMQRKTNRGVEQGIHAKAIEIQNNPSWLRCQKNWQNMKKNIKSKKTVMMSRLHLTGLSCATFTLSITLRFPSGGTRQIPPSVQEGGASVPIDPFNWCSSNYDNRSPTPLLVHLPRCLFLCVCFNLRCRCFPSWQPLLAGVLQMFSGYPSTPSNLLAG